jgi:pathogenesis-related protein 1
MRSVRRSMLRIGWATTAVALLASGLTQGVAAAAPSDTGSAITPAQRDEILAQHNMFRAEVGQPPLVWDATIAAGAQEWADAKQADGKFEHSTTNLGENLAGGEVKDATIRLATGVGVTPPDDERANYQTDPQPTGQEKKKVGHYTQIVWSSTTAVGCGFAPAKLLQFGMVVCRYTPAGNFRGQYPYPPDTALVQQAGLIPVPGAVGGPPPGQAPPADNTGTAPTEKPPGGTGGAPPAENPPGDTGGAPPAENPPGDTGGPPAGGQAPVGDPAGGAPTTCADAEATGLSPSAAEAALGCLITAARTTAGLPGLTASRPARTVAEAIAQGNTPSDVPGALTAAGYCPGGTITSWSYRSAGAGTPQAAFDSFNSNANAIVMSASGDLGIGATAARMTLLSATCG